MVWSVSEKLHGWNTQNFEIRTEERIPRSEYHHKAAEYLAQEQWKRNPDTIPPPKINPSNLTNGRFPINDSQFTLDELDAVIRKQPNNKAPGTHNLRAELVKYLDEENRKALLQFYNDILQSGKIRRFLTWSLSCLYFQKGRLHEIGKLSSNIIMQTFYKLLAAMIKNRLTQGLDDGFHSGKSTSHAISLARRLQSIAEVTGRNISVVMLDWEKAFDRLDHDRLMESLQRLEVPPRLLQLIKDIYTHPKFQVKCEEGSSAFFTAGSRYSSRMPTQPIFIYISHVRCILGHKKPASYPKAAWTVTWYLFLWNSLRWRYLDFWRSHCFNKQTPTWNWSWVLLL